MSKHPEAECGADCFAARLQTGDRKGSYFDTPLPLSGNIKTYFTAPDGESLEKAKEKKYDKIILWMADIFGPWYNNNCLLMDWHAQQGNLLAHSLFLDDTDLFSTVACSERSVGYLVISPDYFHGQQLEKLMEDPKFDKDNFIPQWLVTKKDEEGNDIQRTSLLLKEWIPMMKKMFGKSTTKYGIIGLFTGHTLHFFAR